jgi:lipopolysaccharide heptosyltransferase II
MSWADAQNILCVRLDCLGDVLMTTPAMRALKESVPGRRLTLLGSPAGAAAARLVPEVDDILEFAAPWMKPPAAGAAADDAMRQSLAARHFDAAVIFTVYSQNPLPAAYLCYLAGIPLRLAHCHENPYHLLTDWVADPEPAACVRHEVQRQLDLVAAVGCRAADQGLSFAVPPAARTHIRRRLRAMGVRTGVPLVVVHAGASAASRRYPPEQFAAALNIVYASAQCELVFTGSAQEQALIESIRASLRFPSHSTAGRLDLPELGALIERAELMVANNTGPVHIAAALGTPVVDLYALTNPQHTPWQVASRVLSHDVPCRYCYKSSCPHGHQNCLRLIAPERVAEAALELLEPRLPPQAFVHPVAAPGARLQAFTSRP